MRSLPPAFVLLLGAALFHASSHSAGIGPAPASVPLGSPLSIAVPMVLDDGDAPEPECVTAEVTVGERRVPAFNVRWSVEAGVGPRDRLLRIGTLTVVDEPVVAVQLSVGCTTRITRRFTVFADPPLHAAVAVSAAAADADVVARASAAVTHSGSTRSVEPVPAQSILIASAKRVEPTRVARPTSSASKQPRRARKQTNDSRAAAGAVARAVARDSAPRPRLKLEAAEPIRQEVAQAVQEAASAVATALQATMAARAAEAAASAADARVRALEAQVERLLAEDKQQGRDNQELRERLAAESGLTVRFWLGLAIAGLSVLVVWLAWRLRAARREAQARWWRAAQAEALADLTPDAQPPQPFYPVADSAAPAGPALVDSEETQSAKPARVETGWTTTTPPRAVTVEELIDLEQQAEFFIVLGQDDAAIDLLVSHIRSTGGISPLPYLKLLETHRRRGEPESYERTRTRFNQRFNAYAPDWNTDLQHGRLLESYADVIASLQRVWGNPVDAMDLLETLLFRTDNGQLFDLPAYREVLLLYSLARDLLDKQGDSAEPVDLLLPLEATAAQPGRPTPIPKLDDTQLFGPDVVVEHPGASLSLDLDLGAAFDAEEITHPAAFTELEPGQDSQLADLPNADKPAAPSRWRVS